MARFEDLQELWQHQKPPVARIDTAPLTSALKRYGRRQTWINSIKLIVVLGLIGWQVAQSPGSLRTWCAAALLTVFAMTLLAVDWRSQRAVSRLNFAEPSAGFVRSAIQRLMEQREPLRKYYWPFVLILAAAMNAGLLTLPRSVTPLRRLFWHAAGSAMPFAVYELARWVRATRFEAECRPLVDRLIALQQELEERSE